MTHRTRQRLRGKSVNEAKRDLLAKGYSHDQATRIAVLATTREKERRDKSQRRGTTNT